MPMKKEGRQFPNIVLDTQSEYSKKGVNTANIFIKSAFYIVSSLIFLFSYLYTNSYNN